ncbi:MAG: hypothetical protein ACE1ZC_03140, partial [Nitrososphaerales archaeon]
MTAGYPRSIVLIEGNGRLRDFTNNPKIVYGAVASLVSNTLTGLYRPSYPKSVFLGRVEKVAFSFFISLTPTSTNVTESSAL